MEATKTAWSTEELERFWNAYWVTHWLFQAIFRALDREQWKQFGIWIEPDEEADVGLWGGLPQPVGIVIPFEVRATDELPPDNDSSGDIVSRIYDKAMVEAAQALMAIGPDRLKALAAELLAEALIKQPTT